MRGNVFGWDFAHAERADANGHALTSPHQSTGRAWTCQIAQEAPRNVRGCTVPETRSAWRGTRGMFVRQTFRICPRSLGGANETLVCFAREEGGSIDSERDGITD